ncbi:MAG TPA: carbohydrate ABC transporter permease [Actinospica sp.]|jgi:ABC-type glycerol-3-phosphate transport system permease component|nr:carbohydrate ABC transporter permease [Actinospica sp.]
MSTNIVTRRRPRGFGALLSWLAQLPLAIWTLIVLAPFVMITLLGLRSNLDIYAHPLGFGGSYHFDNISSAWDGPLGSSGMSTFFRNTIIAAVTALVVNLTAGTTAAYFATKLSDRMRTWYLRLFLLGTVVPFVLLLIPYYQAYSAAGLIDSPVALGVAYAALGLPNTVLILNAYFRDFPKEITEAAALDGLGEFGCYLRIVLPLSRGAITGVSMLLLVWVWSETQLGLVLLQDSYAQTVAVGLLGFRSQFTSDLGPLFAGLTISMMPILVLYLFFSRFITKGIALGGSFR